MREEAHDGHGDTEELLLHCTVINAALFFIAVLVTSLAGDTVYRLQRRFYDLPRETLLRSIYALLGFYKILILVFNLVPYLALVAMG